MRFKAIESLLTYIKKRSILYKLFLFKIDG